jgi:hypothetical protein
MKMNRLPKREEGSIFIWSAVGLAVLIAFAGLATDVPYVYVARHQAQTAADAGALAGGYGLLAGTASQDAKAFAGKTPIIGTLLTASQIDAFTCDSIGGTVPECATNSADPDQVTCITHRDVAHGNPMPLFLLPILQIFGAGRATANASGWDAANVSATATARLVNTCGGCGFAPWSIADRWVDTNGDGNFDSGIDQYDPVTTGYNYPADIGLQVILKVGNPSAAITPGIFYPIDLPPLNKGTPITGGNQYEENIGNGCEGNNTIPVEVGDLLQAEPGSMVGPTKHGVRALIDQDPTATWAGDHVNSPLGASSPRLKPFAFFDPRIPVESGRNYVTVIKVGGFFIEGLVGNDVIGRFTPVIISGAPPGPSCGGLKAVVLVK